MLRTALHVAAPQRASGAPSQRNDRRRPGARNPAALMGTDEVLFPPARRDEQSFFTAHGRRFADPYAWLARLEDRETGDWIAAQEAASRTVLDAVPGRDWLREKVARGFRYSRRSVP